MKMKIARIKAGLTQQQLRAKTGVALNTIVRLERGQVEGTTVNTLKKIADALGYSIGELFFSDEE